MASSINRVSSATGPYPPGFNAPRRNRLQIPGTSFARDLKPIKTLGTKFTEIPPMTGLGLPGGEPPVITGLGLPGGTAADAANPSSGQMPALQVAAAYRASEKYSNITSSTSFFRQV